MVVWWLGFRPSRIKFSGGDASCDGTGEPRHFQKRFQNQRRNQKRKSRPYSSKRNYQTTKRWEKKKEGTRWAGKKWAGKKWEGTRWEGREREEKEGPRLTRGGKCKEG